MNIDQFIAQEAQAVHERPARTPHALRSTGPRTPEGKAASSLNAIKHGLTARQVVIKGENQADFDALLERLTLDRKPSGELEIETVGEIAACTWRLARARGTECKLLESDFDLFQRGGPAAGFERLQRYMGSIERQLSRAITRLERLQAERRKLEAAKPASAAREPKAEAAAPPTRKPEFVSSNSPAPSAPAASAASGAPFRPDLQ